MMRWLVSSSLQLRVIVVALMFVLLYVGFDRLSNTPMDVFPEFAPPYVEVQTEAPGLSTPEVEALITIPLENALNGTPQMQKLRSKSVLGLSSVVLYFEKGIDVMEARQHVQERLSRVAGTLPSVARPPVMLSPLSSTSRILKVGVSSDSLSQMDMTTIIRWNVRPRLMAIPGVANVAIWGQRDKQYQILIRPERLRLHNITMAEVQQAASGALQLAGGGFMDTPNQRLAIASTQGIGGVSALAQVPVSTRNGNIIRLGDVANITIGTPPPIGDAVINDGPGLLLIVEKQPGANTLEVTHNVEAALAALKPGLPGMELDSTIFRPASFIEMSLEHLNTALLLGCLLVVLVLAFFLYDWRTALISVTALPCSLVGAALVLHYTGKTLDTMVLAGLIIALGEVVDDAIIDVENIARRLRLNRMAETPEPAFKVVLEASMEVRSAVIYGSMIVALVLLPVFMLPGLAGSFFQPLALSYITAILVSLLIALTLTPALSLLLLPTAPLREKEPPAASWLKTRYRRLLPALLARPKRVVATLAVTLAASALVVPFLGEEFLPHFKEYDFLMHWVEKPGTSLEAMKRVTVAVSKDLRGIKGVRNFGAHIGRAEVADEVVGPNFTELWISVDPDVPDYDATVAEIQQTIDGYPGLFRDVLTYLRERIKEVLTGTSASIVVRLYGPDLDTLYAKATEMGARIQNVEGVTDLKVQQQTLVPQIQVRFRPAAALQFGVSPGDVTRAVSTLMRGTKVGEVYQEQKVFDVVVWGEPAIRNDINAFRNLLVDVPNGAKVPLRDLADIRIVPAPNEITRENSSRKIDVTCNVKGRDLGSVARDIEASVAAMDFEAGYHPELLGEYAEQRRSANTLLSISLISLVGVFLVLYADFKSFRLAGLVMGSLLFALTGCVVATLLSGGVLSLGSIVGFVTVLGIAARNTIMLISHYRFLEFNEQVPFGKALIMQGAEERIMPIIMTALTSVLALLPIILTGNRSGQEIEYPMAVVIVGGILTSTLLNLLFMPTLYYRWGGRTVKR
ncbi:efflux RND transporter permease subunit [Pontibacter sp. E15-1]|uniref:efflux RND transporter permease subunit n=1 Tax=Pontibacter sp. E15-1 TaxID=2919918 RepID=UPI001F4FDB2B|nr:efflux RND transporter permease subunit [Pontibacter sp. E15-1]MCJ8164370.1 efflux RND transporter permease subunit [Pontibacter sp. E15-1]